MKTLCMKNTEKMVFFKTEHEFKFITEKTWTLWILNVFYDTFLLNELCYRLCNATITLTYSDTASYYFLEMKIFFWIDHDRPLASIELYGWLNQFHEWRQIFSLLFHSFGSYKAYFWEKNMSASHECCDVTILF